MKRAVRQDAIRTEMENGFTGKKGSMMLLDLVGRFFPSRNSMTRRSVWTDGVPAPEFIAVASRDGNKLP